MAVKTSAIVLAAGQGKRMNSKIQKQYLLLREKPVLYYTLRAFQDSGVIDEIILVTGSEEVEYCKDEFVKKYGFDKIRAVVPGGKERYHSVAEGLGQVRGEYVFIHDGARPFLSEDVIERTYRCAVKEGACIAAVPVKDTIKLADEEKFVKATLPRQSVWSVQTPQVFRKELIREAYESLIREEEDLFSRGIQITDDAMVVETFTGHPVKIVEGSYRNIKITTPEDLKTAESFLS